MRTPCLSRRVLVIAVVLTACSPREVPIVETAGACADVFQGQICTWARTRGDSLIDFGATVPLASIENAPAEVHEMHWPPAMAAEIKLPEIATQRTGLTDLTVYWEPMGHPPGPYLTPHFDFHFYTVSSDDRRAIDCSDTAKPAAIPEGYTLPDVTLPPDVAKAIGTETLVGLCVPQMGMHAVPTSELASTSPFRGTMIIGYTKDRAVFVEPMLSKAMLLEKAPFAFPIPTVLGLSGNYPRAFRAEFDAQSNSYRFILSGGPAEM